MYPTVINKGSNVACDALRIHISKHLKALLQLYPLSKGVHLQISRACQYEVAGEVAVLVQMLFEQGLAKPKNLYRLNKAEPGL